MPNAQWHWLPLDILARENQKGNQSHMLLTDRKNSQLSPKGSSKAIDMMMTLGRGGGSILLSASQLDQTRPEGHSTTLYPSSSWEEGCLEAQIKFRRGAEQSNERTCGCAELAHENKLGVHVERGRPWD
ncbi:hypothetical protein SAY86_024873 [Trapa natans]|uniref:Uncharacterized protein n=1 Tax=Trapa natans TaxID=22666 RepID=A0AAN7MVN7_TRANT|nr:hypothetical protein SAY86_024873 [Trapa natans]